ncbi:hypothetical protein [Flavobacterium sp.]|jgi:hypothetical protein|uniref:hypothetical protein n=1 Tax=Flavobacterium sp. TaxID=239 RepID=UPI0037C1348A
MQSKSILLFLLGSSLFFISCKKTEEASTSTEQKTETTATEKPAANDASKITTTPAQAATQTATPAGQPPKLNPPHGQPYHRCEIAVGAPLDGSAQSQGASPAPVQQNAPKSFFKTVQTEQQANPTQTVAAAPAPAKQVTPTQQVKPAATPASSTANAAGPKPKNNPAHGQPHHRCDIKVGDPLPDA